jgi:hypothetical protein
MGIPGATSFIPWVRIGNVPEGDVTDAWGREPGTGKSVLTALVMISAPTKKPARGGLSF